MGLNDHKTGKEANPWAQGTDEALEEWLEENRPKPLFDAFFIGFLIGILIFGAAANAWGFFALIPLVLIYMFLKKPKQYAAAKQEWERRKGS